MVGEFLLSAAGLTKALQGEALLDFSRWRNLLSIVTVGTVIGLAPPFTHIARAQSEARSSTAAEKDIRAATMLFYAAFNSALHGNLAPLTAVGPIARMSPT